MSNRNTATKPKQPAPVDADAPIPYAVAEADEHDAFHEIADATVSARILAALESGATCRAEGMATFVHQALRGITAQHEAGTADAITVSYLITLTELAGCAAELAAIEHSRHETAAMAGGAK